MDWFLCRLIKVFFHSARCEILIFPATVNVDRFPQGMVLNTWSLIRWLCMCVFISESSLSLVPCLHLCQCQMLLTRAPKHLRWRTVMPPSLSSCLRVLWQNFSSFHMYGRNVFYVSEERHWDCEWIKFNLRVIMLI